jgi:hypothetical protein
MILPLIFLKTLAHKIEMIRNQLRNDIDRIKWKNLEIYFNYRPTKKSNFVPHREQIYHNYKDQSVNAVKEIIIDCEKG